MLYIYLPVLYYHGNLYVTEMAYAGAVPAVFLVFDTIYRESGLPRVDMVGIVRDNKYFNTFLLK